MDPRGGGGSRLARIIAAAALAAVIGAVAWLAVTHPGGMGGAETGARLLFLVLVLLMAVSGVAIRSMKDLRRSFRHAGLWLAVFAVLILAHSFRPEAEMLLNRLTAAVNPAGGSAGETSVTFTASRGGHFMINADVDGVTVRFLVDTGASRVVLNRRDARRLGFNPDTLDYSQTFNSANGQGRGAPVRLGRISAGPAEVHDVRATVNKADMDVSLLGMSFLSHTGGYSVESGVLTIRR
ncbi:MAG: retropepsin-like aspartic protease family protein [Rhodospirillales bacterium]